jgi:hypothetical protein
MDYPVYIHHPINMNRQLRDADININKYDSHIMLWRYLVKDINIFSKL